MADAPKFPIDDMDDRSRDIFRRIVQSYLEAGEPIGSKHLSKLLPHSLSPASIRNVMGDLEQLGLIYSPHVSAGRLPTEQGLRFFVDAFMDAGEASPDERKLIEKQLQSDIPDQATDSLLAGASAMLSNISQGAGLVVAAKREEAMKHIEFVRLEDTKALAIIVWDSGEVENRVVELPPGITASQLSESANFLNHHVRGQTLDEAKRHMAQHRTQLRQQLDKLSADLVDRGLAVWSGNNSAAPSQLIVRGRSKLLENLEDAADVERVKLLLDDLERKEEIVQFLDLAQSGSGVRIFIGSENRLFSLSGSSLIVAPYRDSDRKVVGALGIIGPTRLNYARIVPVVDYTAQLISKMVDRQ